MRRQIIHRMGFMDTLERHHRWRHGVQIGYVVGSIHCTVPIDVRFEDMLYQGVIRVVQMYVGDLLWKHPFVGRIELTV